MATQMSLALIDGIDNCPSIPGLLPSHYFSLSLFPLIPLALGMQLGCRRRPSIAALAVPMYVRISCRALPFLLSVQYMYICLAAAAQLGDFKSPLNLLSVLSFTSYASFYYTAPARNMYLYAYRSYLFCIQSSLDLANSSMGKSA